MTRREMRNNSKIETCIENTNLNKPTTFERVKSKDIHKEEVASISHRHGPPIRDES